MTPLLLALTLLRGADATTTLMAGHERNPFLPGNPRIAVSLLVPITALQVYELHRRPVTFYTWDQETHTYVTHRAISKRRLVLAIASVAVEGIVVARNVQTLRSRR